MKNIHAKDFNVLSILRDLLKNLVFIVIGAVACAFIAYSGINTIHADEYTSSITLVVSQRATTASTAYSNLTTANEISGVFRSILSSELLKNKVARSVGRESLPGELSATVLGDTNLIMLSATAPSPDEAYRTIKAVMENYTEVSDFVFSDVVITVLEVQKCRRHRQTSSIPARL